MKKKIAVFANGWSDEFTRMVLSGVRKFMADNSLDVFLFVDFSTADVHAENIGETNIVRLPGLDQFDGVMILSNTFNSKRALSYLHDEVKRIGLPAVSLELELEGVDYIGTENYYGMYDLTEHMIGAHGVKSVLFIGGQRDNDESNTRCSAVRDALEHNGYNLPNENIIYGDFSDSRAQEVWERWLESHEKFPDAIICANDTMAMGICLWMKNHGYSVPGDIRVTGYDCIESARTCYPSITSVGRDWDKMGYESVKHLMERMEGKSVSPHKAMKSRFEPAESCGCSAPQLEAARAADIRNTSYGRKRENLDFDMHSRALYMYLRGVSEKEQVFRAFKEFFDGGQSYEGDNFAICLVEDFFDTIISEAPLRIEGYGEKMDVICRLKDGKALPRKHIETQELVPDYDGVSHEGHLYLFVPLHSEDKCMGYAVLRDKDDMVDNYRLYTWSKHMNQYLEQIRLNIRMEELNSRLTKLSVTDALTGIYNRLGYEKYAIPYLEKCRQENKNGVMMFADINRMKHINDKYGHLQGDNAIRAVAGALRRVMPEDWITVRYGGDEFLSAGECASEEQIQMLEQQIHDALGEEIERMAIPFELTVSVGAVYIDNDADLSIEECFKKADESMYEMKKRNHAAAETRVGQH